MSDRRMTWDEVVDELVKLQATHIRLRDAATRLCGAASRAALAAPSSGPLWHGSQEIKELQEALLSDEFKSLMLPKLQEAEG